MNFEVLKKAASTVSEAALSFNQLDNLAQQDDYIHSPDLKISGRGSGAPTKKKTTNSREVPSSASEDVVATENGEVEQQIQVDMVLSSSNSSRTRNNNDSNGGLLGNGNSNSHQRQQQQLLHEEDSTSVSFPSNHSIPLHVSKMESSTQSTGVPPPKKQNTMPLLSVVSDLMNNTPTPSEVGSVAAATDDEQKSTTTFSRNSSINQLDKEIGNASDDEDVDPILDAIRKERSGDDQSYRSSSSSSQIDSYSNNNNYINSKIGADGYREKKNPNRFMEDLDERLSKPQRDIEEGGKNLCDNTFDAPPVSSFLESENKWDWMKKAATSKLSQLMTPTPQDETNTNIRQQEMTSLTSAFSSARQQQNHLKKQDDDDIHHITVSSSSMLGSEEQAELERLKQASRTDIVSILITATRENPQTVFVAVLLVLAMYFYWQA